uniref:Tudor domain-containing protein n=1 Tax=Timema shepardi TaxID=629360 RepID=A0A7R9G3S2_TIMSH|nr:unnamed protein product [Timema shepardi]
MKDALYWQASSQAKAIRVRLVDGTPREYHNLKEGKDISIKRIDIASDGVAFVRVNGVTYTDSQLSAALYVTLAEAAEGPATLTDKTEETLGLPGKLQVTIPVPPSVHNSFIEYVVPGATGALEILKLYSNHFVASIVTKGKDCIEVALRVSHSSLMSSDRMKPRPCVGDIVAAMLPSKGSFHRAMVISVEPDGYMVNFCDQGTIKLVSVIKKLPNKYICLPQAAIKCRVLTYLIPEEQFYLEYYKERTSFLFKDVKFLGNKKTCVLMDLKETPLCEIAMIPRETRPEGNHSKGILSNGDMVMLLQCSTDGLIIVTPAEKNLIEDFKLFSKELNVHCKELKLRLGKLPAKGDLVACQYLVDMNYYRARVLSIKDEVISVFFVDYGNIDTDIPLSLMVKPLNEKFKKRKVSFRHHYPEEQLALCLLTVIEHTARSRACPISTLLAATRII